MKALKFLKQWKKKPRVHAGLLDDMIEEWDDEPDKAYWIDEKTNLDCLIVRNLSGCLCGYVGVPPEHVLHGRDYYDEAVLTLQCHGGITFNGTCIPNEDESRGICHPTLNDRPEVWWFGFDCGHSSDVVPALVNRGVCYVDYPAVYRNIKYVVAQVEMLAEQLKAIHVI